MAYQHYRVTTLACSCNGTWLVSGGSEGTVGVMTSDDLCLYRYHGHEDVVRSLAFSPVGTAVVSASGDSSVQIWDVVTGKCQKLYTGHKDLVEAAVWSPDGKLVASCDKREVQVWEAGTGKLCFFRSSPVALSGIAWSSDGRYLAASTYSDVVLIWDHTGNRIGEYSSGRRTILSMAWSPGGHYLALGSDGLRGISVLHLGEKGMREVMSYGEHTGAMSAIAWSNDGKYLASTSNEHLHIWNIGERGSPHTIDRIRHFCAITCVVWMPLGVAFGDERGSVHVHTFGPSLSKLHQIPQALFFSLQKVEGGIVHVGRPGKVAVWSLRDEVAAQNWLTMNNAFLLEASSRGWGDGVTGTYRMDGPTIVLPY